MIGSTTLSALALAAIVSGSAAQNQPAPKPPAPAPKPAAQQPTPPAPKPAAVKPAAPKAPKVKETSPGLLKQATVAADAAEQTALGAVPGGKVSSRMITKEKGALVYVFSIKTQGQEGYNRVSVDANAGTVVSNTHKAGMATGSKTKAPPKPKP